MTVISSIFWVFGLILSVTIAPQLRIWTWGPCMLCFGIASIFALPNIWKNGLGNVSFFTLLSGLAISTWIIVRAYASPVAELAISDALLVCIAVSTFIVFKNASQENLSEKILLTGIAAILVATVYVITIQVTDRTYSPIFPLEVKKLPSGFHGHYSYCASFLIPCSLLLIAQGIIRKFHWSVRSLLISIGSAGLLALVYTFSRGGIIGAGFGIVTLIAGLILLGFRDQKKWFSPLAIIFPIALIALAITFFVILGNVQESRTGKDLESMMDNSIRFYLLGIAISAAQTHLWLGGGSRSFSWECFQFWDVEAFGLGKLKPEHVHNELIQAITDYGILGGSLLGIFIFGICITAIIKHLQKSDSPKANHFDAWRIGGFAGFVGMFIQSNLEGIFSIPPGALSLAMCLAAAGLAVHSTTKKDVQLLWVKKALLIFTVTLSASGLIFYGYKGTKLLPSLWPVYFSQYTLNEEYQIGGLTSAIQSWPLHSLVKKRAIQYRDLSLATEDPNISEGFKQLALKDFISATKLHPHDPYNFLNVAKILQTTSDQDAASFNFLRATQLQGGMESAFKANQNYASYLLSLALANYDPSNPIEAINQIQIAARYIQTASALTENRFDGAPGRELAILVYETLGKLYEASGEHQAALDQFDHAATFHKRSSSHYLASFVLSKQARIAWLDRRAPDGLRLFLEADIRLSKTGKLPGKVTREDRREYKKYLDSQIKFLQGARVTPSEEMPSFQKISF